METMQTVFRRYEKKYRLTPGQYTGIRRALEGWMQPDRFYRSQIRSIYFDTPDRRLVRRSLEKPVYKEKLRLRSYGLPGAEDPVFVELKKKYQGVVYKRREVMTLREAEAYLYRGRARSPGFPDPAGDQPLPGLLPPNRTGYGHHLQPDGLGGDGGSPAADHL